MDLAELVSLVARLRATTKKTEKVALIAGLLRPGSRAARSRSSRSI